MRPGSPLIELVRVVYDQAGCGVEHLHALYRPDRYAFEIDLVRSGAAKTIGLGAGHARQRQERPQESSHLQ